MNGCLRPGGFPETGCHPPSQTPGLNMSIWAECLPRDTTWKVHISLSYPSSPSGGTCSPLQTALRQQRVQCSHFCKIPKSRWTKGTLDLGWISGVCGGFHCHSSVFVQAEFQSQEGNGRGSSLYRQRNSLLSRQIIIRWRKPDLPSARHLGLQLLTASEMSRNVTRNRKVQHD